VRKSGVADEEEVGGGKGGNMSTRLMTVMQYFTDRGPN